MLDCTESYANKLHKDDLVRAAFIMQKSNLAVAIKHNSNVDD